MEERSGLPPENERALLPSQEKMKQSLPEATLVVFPARVGGKAADAASAANLAKTINDAGLFQAEPAKQSLLLKASLAGPNELKSLWDLAREFRDYAREHQPDATTSSMRTMSSTRKTGSKGLCISSCAIAPASGSSLTCRIRITTITGLSSRPRGKAATSFW